MAILSTQAGIAGAFSALAVLLGYLTTRAMRAACRGQVDSVSLAILRKRQLATMVLIWASVRVFIARRTS